MKTIRMFVVVMATAALAAAAPPAGTPQRLIVVLKAGSEPLPDIAALGGVVEFKLADRMIVTVPAEAVAEIGANPRVQYVQRSGAQAAIDAESLHVAPTSGPGQWSTGAYVYDGTGNISAIGTGAEPNSDAKTNAYAYDKVGRLVQGTANYAVGSHNDVYVYDPFGNMTSRARDGAPAIMMQVDHATNRRASPVQYDAAGNEKLDPATSSTRRFDALNMMTYKHSGSVEEYYIYAPDDQRIGVLAAASHNWTWSLRDEGGALLRQYGSSETTLNADWLWVEDYVYAGGRLLGAERMASQGGRRHFHLDHLGTPRLITGPTGTLIARHDYLPFGEEVTLRNAEILGGLDRVEPRQFTGHERDSGDDPAATLDYMHARYYNGSIARFISVDPHVDEVAAASRPVLWNRYSYANGNPINVLDPDGRNGLTAMSLAYEIKRSLESAATHFRNAERAMSDIADVSWIAEAHAGPVSIQPSITVSDHNVVVENTTKARGFGGEIKVTNKATYDSNGVKTTNTPLTGSLSTSGGKQETADAEGSKSTKTTFSGGFAQNFVVSVDLTKAFDAATEYAKGLRDTLVIFVRVTPPDDEARKPNH